MLNDSGIKVLTSETFALARNERGNAETEAATVRKYAKASVFPLPRNASEIVLSGQSH